MLSCAFALYPNLKKRINHSTDSTQCAARINAPRQAAASNRLGKAEYAPSRHQKLALGKDSDMMRSQNPGRKPTAIAPPEILPRLPAG
jgi:hypothetical protein